MEEEHDTVIEKNGNDGSKRPATIEQLTGKSFDEFIRADYSALKRTQKQHRAYLRKDSLSLDEKLKAEQALRQADMKLRKLRMHVFEFEDAVTDYVNGRISADGLTARSGGFDKAARQIITEVSSRKNTLENTATQSENPPLPTDKYSGFQPGTVLRHQNRHIRDVYLVVGKEKDGGRYLLLGDEPVRTPVLRESPAGELEPVSLRAFQTSLVYENTDADKAYRLFEKNAARYESRYELISKSAFFTSFGRAEHGMDIPPAGQASSKKHYSEKIIPDLAKQYLPSTQTPSDKLEAAKDSYVKQTLTLPSTQQERRRLLESQMESLIKGLPEQTQMQARINFYTSQVEERLRQIQKPEPSGQSEISFDR